ncbi:MAG: alanine racemase [Firmicutes bacterium]|nr:alanine racemase [Bacillota bacterium]
MAQSFSGPQLAQDKTKAADLNFSAWIEVDLNALEENLQEIERHTQATLCPILKGDAYGHGAPVVSAFLESKGLRLLGVSDLDEALEIIPFTSAKILMLTPPLPSQIPLVLKQKIIPCVSSSQLISQLGLEAQKQKQTVPLHLKIDTGLGRLGAELEEAEGLARLIKKNPYLKLEGVFTHFTASTKTELTRGQLRRFLEIKNQLSAAGYSALLWHAANSGALVSCARCHLDLVRIGTLLYGQAPCSLDRSWRLKDTWSFHTRLIQIKELPAGRSVGYGPSYRTRRPTIVGIIPVGYQDGLELEPSTTLRRQLKQLLKKAIEQKKPAYLPDGSPLPILGRIGMSLTCLDLSKHPQLQIGAEVLLSMRRTTAAKSIPKVYLQDGKIKCVYKAHRILNLAGAKHCLRGLF